jgi:hypothetical protein
MCRVMMGQKYENTETENRGCHKKVTLFRLLSSPTMYLFETYFESQHNEIYCIAITELKRSTKNNPELISIHG